MIIRILGFAALVFAAAVGIGPAAAENFKIAIGMSGGINQVPSLIALEKGFFKEQGLDVELKPLSRGAQAIEGVSGGSLQFSESAHAPFLSAVAKGVPLVSVGIAARGFYGKLLAANRNANLKTLADFKGKHIGTQVGTGMYTVILMLLEKEGLKPTDFNFTNLRVVDMPAAMISSDTFDAVIGWEPSIQRIVQAGKGKVIITPRQFEEMAEVTYPFLLSTSQQFHKEHPDMVQKVVNGYAKAHKYIVAHKDEAVKAYVNEVKRRGAQLSEDDVRLMLFDTDRYGGAAFNSKDMKDINATLAFLVKTGKIKTPPMVDKVIDQSFGKKAEAATN